MSIQLSDEQLMIQTMVRDFSREVIDINDCGIGVGLHIGCLQSLLGIL